MSTPRQSNRNRPPSSPRPIHITFDRLSRVDGSARFSFGPPTTGPTALATLSGPIEVRLASENPTHATLDVLVRPLSNVPATEAKALGAAVRSVLVPSVLLGQMPRTLVQIVAQALVVPDASGSAGGMNLNAITAALVNASTLALLNSGCIPMRGVVCAVAVGRRRSSGDLVVDPDEGDGALDAEGCFAYMFTRDAGGDVRGKCVWTNWRAVRGAFDEGVLGEAREVAGRGAREVYEAVYGGVEGMEKRVAAHAPVAAVVRKEVEEEEEMEI
ncbi:hypothetical protein FPV67DRAFT_512728 [Lyophyllum atratum]|nr:hypothetical protein FPV67DRAFT_512728 [Lyophyllum atratum]